MGSRSQHTSSRASRGSPDRATVSGDGLYLYLRRPQDDPVEIARLIGNRCGPGRAVAPPFSDTPAMPTPPLPGTAEKVQVRQEAGDDHQGNQLLVGRAQAVAQLKNHQQK